MEGYAENGAGTDVTDQIGFGGMRRKRRKHRGLTVFQLKVIGAVALFFSAGSTTIVPLFFGSDLNNMTSLTAVVLSEVASWFAIPIYAWLLVRGFRETHNRVAYGVQLLLLALICEVPYDLATSGKTFDFNSQNPVFGLFIAFVVLAALEWVAARYQKAMRVVLSGRPGGNRPAVGPAAACRSAAGADEHRFRDTWLRADLHADALA